MFRMRVENFWVWGWLRSETGKADILGCSGSSWACLGFRDAQGYFGSVDVECLGFGRHGIPNPGETRS